MIRKYNADGTWRDLTDEQFIAEFGEAAFRKFEAPVIEEADMTEGQKYLAKKMQSEHEVNAAAERAGIASIFDLPSEDDDDTISIEDLEPREYDDAGAASDLEARRKAKDR